MNVVAANLPAPARKLTKSLSTSMDKYREEPKSWLENGFCLRRRLHFFITHRMFDIIIGAVITFNLVVVIFETDDEASGGLAQQTYAQINHVLLTVYCVELVIKLYTFRCWFFHEYWNCLDFFIVTLDLAFMCFGAWLDGAPSFNFLRIFRLARLLRAFRMASLFPELNLLMKGFFGAMRAIFWGVLMVCLLLSVWSILAVKLIHPINEDLTNKGVYTRAGCDRCPEAFSSVWHSSLTFFQQVVAGDSWGTVSLPIIDEAPWTAFFFMAVLVSVSLAMLNLILAVICEAATEARQQSFADQAEERAKQMQQHKQKMMDLCAEMDDDHSGSVSFNELLKGWDSSKEFAHTLTAMDIGKDDMEMIFNVLDTDGSGDVHYEEFVDQLHMLKTNQSRLILFSVMEISCKFEERFKALSKEIDKLVQNAVNEVSDDTSNMRSAEGGSGNNPAAPFPGSAQCPSAEHWKQPPTEKAGKQPAEETTTDFADGSGCFGSEDVDRLTRSNEAPRGDGRNGSRRPASGHKAVLAEAFTSLTPTTYVL